MRYNTYRQYKTLSGYRRNNNQKSVIIKNLNPVIKNVLNFLPSDQFEEFRENHQKITYRFKINVANQIKEVTLLAWDTVGGTQQITDSKNISIPEITYFRGIYDGNYRDLNNQLEIQFYTQSDQTLSADAFKVNNPYPQIQPPDLSSNTKFTSTFFSIISEFPTNYHITMEKPYNSDGWHDAFYDIRIPHTLSYVVIDFDVTDYAYDSIPAVPIVVFE